MTKKPCNAGKSIGQRIKQLFCRHNWGWRRIGLSADGYNIIESERCFKCDKMKFVKHSTTKIMKDMIETLPVKNNFTVVKNQPEPPYFSFSKIGDYKKW